MQTKADPYLAIIGTFSDLHPHPLPRPSLASFKTTKATVLQSGHGLPTLVTRYGALVAEQNQDRFTPVFL